MSGITHLCDVPLKDLDASQRYARNKGAEILRCMRRGESLTSACRAFGKKTSFAHKNVGRYLAKYRNRWVATPSDNLQIAFPFYEKEHGYTTLVTTSSEDRSLIGEYMNRVKKALHTGDKSVLNKFKEIEITDADDKVHRFETDLDRLYEIEEEQEEPEFYELYE